MGERLIIIVTGTSATGKTILSKKLANKFNLPLINKDEIKELLFDCLDTKDEEWGVQLGITSFKLSYLFVEKLCQTGKDFIVEGNFEDKFATKVFSDLKMKYNYKILQLYCHAPEEILYKRYIERDNSGKRHPGHIIQIGGLDEFKKRVTNKNFKLKIDNCINIDVDTTEFEDIRLQEIYDEIIENINL
ncbi:AAA family ATPase [Clostridium sp.]|uniref:AAA family ATPase n=1 Tax=Clostridium sp. TaxID=1506 RepID=UPI003D6D77F9